MFHVCSECDWGISAGIYSAERGNVSHPLVCDVITVGVFGFINDQRQESHVTVIM